MIQLLFMHFPLFDCIYEVDNGQVCDLSIHVVILSMRPKYHEFWLVV